MKGQCRLQPSTSNRLLFLFVLFVIYCSLFTVAEAKIYIDITSPSFRKLPIAVSEFAGISGKEISEIIKDDLDFTGIFSCLGSNAFIESSEQTFNQKNWTAIGAETVVKGTIKKDAAIVAKISLFDVLEGREFFSKEYQAEASMTRQIAHTIANDIYKQITGENGIFRTRIAYVTKHTAYDELAIMDWDGQRTMTPGIKGSILLGPRWSADGAELLYSSERNRQWKIYMLDFKKSMEKDVFYSKGTNIAGGFSGNNDEMIMSSSMNGPLNLYAYKISESRLTRLTTSRGIDVSPSASPDGSRIAFVSDRDGSPQIFIMDSNGYDVRRLTFNGSYNTSPSWSPLGDRLVFSGRQAGKNQIFVINPDGSDLGQLTEHGNNEDPSFSPDGRYIVYTSDRNGDKNIYIMRSDGTAQKRITPRGMRAFGPRWSPN